MFKNLLQGFKPAKIDETVDGILESFIQHRDRLEALANRLFNASAEAFKSAEEMEELGKAHAAEADRATKAAKRVSDLVG